MTLVREPFDHRDWIHELKLEGFRLECHLQFSGNPVTPTPLILMSDMGQPPDRVPFTRTPRAFRWDEMSQPTTPCVFQNEAYDFRNGAVVFDKEDCFNGPPQAMAAHIPLRQLNP
jgi:hypothetical protein